jgi:hypothetical protein
MRTAWIVVLAACGGGGKGGLSVDGYFDQSFETTCSQAHECRAQFPTDQGFTFEELFQDSEPACVANFQQLNDENVIEIQASVDAGRIIFRPGDAAACDAFFDDLSCADLWGAIFENDPPQPASCETAFEGTVPAGGTCTNDLDCVDFGCDDTTMTCG